MAKCFIKKGDTVKVITGKDAGKTGKVLRVYPKTERILIENINVIKKHMKANPQKNVTGGIVDREAAIHQSNVKVINRED